MERVADGPSAEDVGRCGNLCISFWARPALQDLARNQYRVFLSHLLEGTEWLLLLGHRPGAISGLAPEILCPELAALLGRAEPCDPGSPFRQIGRDDIGGNRHLWSEGAIVVRRRVLDAAGQPRVESIHGGHWLAHVSPEDVCGAFERCPPDPDVQVSVGVITNPYAGFRQNHRRQLLDSIERHPHDVTVMWSEANRAVRVFGTRTTLQALVPRLVADRRAGEA